MAVTRTLSVIAASTREGRAGFPIAEWLLGRARQHGKFSPALVDLQEVDLPLLDEPHHPRLRKYQHEYTKAWSARVKASDAFVFVTPEYNFGMPPSLLNALDYLYVEWNYKACGFVSYGGISGGTRSVQMARGVIIALKMMPIVEAVTIPFFSKQIENGLFKATDAQDQAASVMLDELLRWTEALGVLRIVEP